MPSKKAIERNRWLGLSHLKGGITFITSHQPTIMVAFGYL